MDQAPFEPSKSTRGGDTRTPQARVDIARREEQIVAFRLRHIPFAARSRAPTFTRGECLSRRRVPMCEASKSGGGSI